MILMLCMAATAAYAQTDGAGTATSPADSLRMDSIIHALPEVMVKGERPVVKVEGSKLVYDMPQLLKKEGAENVYDALKLIPGVTDDNGSPSRAKKLNWLPVTASPPTTPIKINGVMSNMAIGSR